MGNNNILLFACFMARILPRGKGVVPRGLGRLTKRCTHKPISTRHGALLPVVPEALDVYVTMTGQNNSWDYWVFRVINAMLEAEAVLYDVGANVGYMSVEVAHLRAKDSIQVYAFEPQKRLAENIEQAIQKNNLNNLQVFQVALGDCSGQIDFAEKRHSVHGAVANAVSPKSYSVPVLKLDNAANTYNFKGPDVIKIDVEGFEYAVLTGASELIQEYRPVVIFEISEGTKDYGYTPSMLQALFPDTVRYQYFTVKGSPVDLQTLTVPAGGHVDVVAVPDQRMSRFCWFLEKLASGEIDDLWG